MDVAICRDLVLTGSIQLEVFNGINLIASSTQSASSIPTCTPQVNPNDFYWLNTRTTFVFNNPLQTVDGVSFDFKFTKRTNSTNNTYFIVTRGSDYLISTSSTTFIPGQNSSGASRFENPIFTLRALGSPPQTYSASSSEVFCGTFDIGCYISTGLTFLFIPSEETKTSIDNVIGRISTSTLPKFASTTPFSYMYDIYGYITVLRNGSGTSTNITFSVPLGGVERDIFSSSQLSNFSTTTMPLVRGGIAALIYIVGLTTALVLITRIYSKSAENV